MKKHDEEGLQLMSHCSKCKSRFTKEELQYIGEENGGTILHISCGTCRQNMLVSTLKKDGGIICQGMITDLSLDDAKRMLKAGKVSIDDVLSIHEALQLDNFMKIG